MGSRRYCASHAGGGGNPELGLRIVAATADRLKIELFCTSLGAEDWQVLPAPGSVEITIVRDGDTLTAAWSGQEQPLSVVCTTNAMRYVWLAHTPPSCEPLEWIDYQVGPLRLAEVVDRGGPRDRRQPRPRSATRPAERAGQAPRVDPDRGPRQGDHALPAERP